MENKKDFLLSIARGLKPVKHYYRFYDYVDGVKTLQEEKEICCPHDIEIEAISRQDQIMDE